MVADSRSLVAARLPSTEVVWRRTFVDVIAEWAEPIDDAEDPADARRFRAFGRTVEIGFDPGEWFELIATLYVRSVEDGDLDAGDIRLRADLWADELYDLFFRGAPCIAIVENEIVALERPGGALWVPASPWRNIQGPGTWTENPPAR